MNKSKYFPFILPGVAILMLLAAISLVRAGVLSAPQVVDLEPDPGSHTVPVTSSVSITYDQNMNPATVNPQTFAVHARQTGWLTETLSVVSGTITLDPLNPFHAGELVQASATTATLSLGGEAPLSPTVWQFNTAPWGGNAAFHEHQNFGDVNYSRYAALGDLDGDGDLDVITTYCNGYTRVYHNDGSAIFTGVQSFDHTLYCLTDADLGDLDGDGDLDAILIDLSNPGSNLVMSNDGTGHFTQSANMVSHNDTYGELGDLDGDGDLDFFVASGGFYAGTLNVWKNDGAGVFTLWQDFDTAYEHIDVALGDLDNDGDLDAFTAGWDNTYNKVWMNDGTGIFTETQVITNANTYGVQLGDLDGDGDLDAYLASTTIGIENLPDEVWLNDGTGLFTDSSQRLDTVFSGLPALGDLDADGDLDVYLAGEAYAIQPDEVWANDGTGTFTLFRTVDESHAAFGATLGDLDDDGNLDAMTFGKNYADVGFQVYLNGDWTQATSMLNGTSAYAFATCPDDPDSFYIIGGFDEKWVDTGPLNTTLRYDVDTGDWFTLAPAPIAQFGASAVCNNGNIYLAGGVDVDYYVTNGFYIYNIATNTWSFDTLIPRYVYGAALGTWEGKIYLVGGTEEGWYQGMHPVNRVDVYDIATHIWTADALLHMPVAASFPGYAQAGPYLYLVGGFSGNYNANVTATQRLDLSSGLWAVGPIFTSARAFPAATITEHHLYVVGGEENGGDWLNSSDQVDVLNLMDWPNGSWQDLGDPLPWPSQGNFNNACTEVLTGGEIWALGGINATPTGWIFSDANLYYPTEPCLGNTFAFSLNPESLAESGLPGEMITYTLHITNTGDIPDAYSIEIVSGWVTAAPATSSLWPEESADLLITVTIPPEALPYEQDVATVTVTSQGDSAQVAVATLTTTAQTAYWVDLETDDPAQSGYPGEVVTYTLRLTNTGNITNTIVISSTGNQWEVSVPVTSFELAAGESVDVIVTVSVSEEALAGSEDMVTITATSQGDPEQVDDVTLTTTALSLYGVDLAADDPAQFGYPGEVVTYTLRLTNTGNITDSVVISSTGNLWVVSIPVTSFELAAGASVDVIVYVTVPEDALAGDEDAVTITATSQGDPTQSDLVALTTAVPCIQVYLPVIYK
jgi:N-acetylneuraminic acid mutarotase